MLREKKRRLKLIQLTAQDPFDKRTLSGATFLFYTKFRQFFGDVDRIGGLNPGAVKLSFLFKHPFSFLGWSYLLGTVIDRLSQFYGKRFCWYRTTWQSRFYAKFFHKNLQGKQADFIFADKGSIDIAYLETDIPIVYSTDATFKVMIDYYADFCHLSPLAIQLGNVLEKKALDRCRICVVSSNWARDSVIHDYGIAPDKVVIVHHPANIEKVPSFDSVLDTRMGPVCKILFCGVEWERKGGHFAVQVVRQLLASGISAELQVCGVVVPEVYAKEPFIRSFGFLNRNIQSDDLLMVKLFTEANFLLLPVKAECQPNVFLEAGAYGLPVVTFSIGGIPDVVVDGQNGLCFPKTVLGSDVVREISNIWKDSSRYALMRRNARVMFDEKFCDEAWVRQMNRVLISAGIIKSAD